MVIDVDLIIYNRAGFGCICVYWRFSAFAMIFTTISCTGPNMNYEYLCLQFDDTHGEIDDCRRWSKVLYYMQLSLSPPVATFITC